MQQQALQMKCDEMTLVSELLAQDKQLGVTAAAAEARHMTAQLCSGNTVDGTSTAAGASVTPKYVTCYTEYYLCY
jgi:hypothetical protein